MHRLTPTPLSFARPLPVLVRIVVALAISGLCLLAPRLHAGPPAASASSPASTPPSAPAGPASSPALVAPPTQAPRAKGQEVIVRAVALRTSVYAGEQFPIAVVIDHAEGFHTWPQQDVLPADIAEFAIRTEIGAAPAAPLAARVLAVQYPQPHAARVANPSGTGAIEVQAYSGVAVAFVPIELGSAAASGTITIEVKYQACNDKFCLRPMTARLDVPLTVVPMPTGAGDAGGTNAATPSRQVNEPDLFAGFDQAAFAKGTGAAAAAPASAAAKPVKFEVFGWSFTVDPQGPAGVGTLIALAMLGGLLLNFTPCVLPVIPIKILGLSQAAGDPRRCLLLGSLMSLGVVLFWLAIGLAISFISGFKAINTLFQNPLFPILVGSFMLVMGAGMLGAFNIRLPNVVYMIDPSRESVPGSLAFGVMTAVLSTPCTAPFMGAAAAWAALQPPAISLSTFTAIGVGMALPYLILSARPSLVKKLPRTGPGSELLKQVMGLFILAVAAFFCGLGLSAVATRPPQPPTLVYWWVVGVLAASAGLWMAYRTLSIARSLGKRIFFVVLGLLIAGLSLTASAHLTRRGPIDWVYYTPELFAQAQREKKVVVMDFTADWCLNCKALEAAVLHRPEIVSLLGQPDIVAMKVDLTANNAAGDAKLKELGWVGIPLLAVFAPTASEPAKFDTYTPEVVKQAVAAARGR